MDKKAQLCMIVIVVVKQRIPKGDNCIFAYQIAGYECSCACTYFNGNENLCF